MRRLRKPTSITKYVSSYLIALIVVLSFVMIISMDILADRAIHYDIQGQLIRRMFHNSRQIKYLGGQLTGEDGFDSEDDGIYFQLVDESGAVLLGEFPKGIDVLPIQENGRNRLHTLKLKSKSYYIVERINQRLTKESKKIIYNRAIVRKEDMDSKYEFFMYVTYASIPLMLLFVMVAGWMISRKISSPLVEMAKTTESIGELGALSKRMEYNGRIKELSILANTNNYMLDQVENMFQSQKQFTSDVAHELRTPIAVLLAQCEYAKEYVNTKEEFDEALDVIYRQTQKTNKVVNQLLNLNRLENGRITLELEESDIDEMICSICDDMELKEKNQVEFLLRLGKVNTKVDIGLLYILLQNLIQNAVKYSEKPAKVEITTEAHEEQVRIKIKDFGCGIRQEELQKIFIPFFRADKSRNSEGFGLGLPLARRIAEIHKGKLLVESVYGEGSTFTVFLPKI